MRVVFLQWGTAVAHAAMMVKSCKRLGYEVVQLSDEAAPEIDGVDRVERKPMTSPRMVYRYERLVEVEPPYVMLDTDMLVAQDISDGFGDEQVALSWREHSQIIHKETRRVIPMPYNGGLVFVRDGQFIVDCLAYMKTLEPTFQDWYGDQMALAAIGPRYGVNVLRQRVWNWAPEGPRDAHRDVRIYHFKGPKRKELMPIFAARLGLT